MDRLDVLILCGSAFAILTWRYIERQIRAVTRQIEFDSPLGEVITGNVLSQRKFFSEALKLSDEETDASPDMVRGIRLRVQIWKIQYSGDVAFYGKLGEDPRKRESVHQFPTSASQFRLVWAKHPLIGPTGENLQFDFGSRSREKLEVLLSHKAIIIRARGSRFEWDATSVLCQKFCTMQGCRWQPWHRWLNS